MAQPQTPSATARGQTLDEGLKMAESASHRFGQIIGELLEEIVSPQLESFCQSRGLYLDKKGNRKGVRSGQNVTWTDVYGNNHNLDFVIEKSGSDNTRGRPIAFIETAWRRYTKHSRNKAQEIQGAVLPISDKYAWDKPFLGVILAGEFTENSINQMKSSGFEVALFPYPDVVNAFLGVGIDVNFDETTLETAFSAAIRAIQALSLTGREHLKRKLVESQQHLLNVFFVQLAAVLDRQIETIVLIPLYGQNNSFVRISQAIEFIERYGETTSEGAFLKYEIIVKYSNQDKIEATFQEKSKAIAFLNYIATA
jgi:hypothetical protein